MGTPHRRVDLGDVRIPVSGTESDAMDFTGWRGSAQSVTIYGPGTLTGNVKVQVSNDRGDTYQDKQSDGADIAVAADGSVKIFAVDFDYIRVVSDAAEGAERLFKIVGEEGA